jgi:hypothetical protein
MWQLLLLEVNQVRVNTWAVWCLIATPLINEVEWWNSRDKAHLPTYCHVDILHRAASVQLLFFTPKCLAMMEMKEPPTRKEVGRADIALRKKSARQ